MIVMRTVIWVGRPISVLKVLFHMIILHSFTVAHFLLGILLACIESVSNSCDSAFLKILRGFNESDTMTFNRLQIYIKIFLFIGLIIILRNLIIVFYFVGLNVRKCYLLVWYLQTFIPSLNYTVKCLLQIPLFFYFLLNILLKSPKRLYRWVKFINVLYLRICCFYMTF